MGKFFVEHSFELDEEEPEMKISLKSEIVLGLLVMPNPRRIYAFAWFRVVPNTNLILRASLSLGLTVHLLERDRSMCSKGQDRLHRSIDGPESLVAIRLKFGDIA